MPTMKLGLIGKKMPTRTYISKDEIVALSFKLAKDRLTLLLCGNTAGDYKMKWLLVYHYFNPRTLEGLSKNLLPVHWAANKMVWTTGQYSENCFFNHFISEAEQHRKQQNLAFKVLLLLDNAPGHIHPNVRILVLTPNITSLIQPLDQGILSTLKSCYLRRTISQLLEGTHGSNKLDIRQW